MNPRITESEAKGMAVGYIIGNMITLFAATVIGGWAGGLLTLGLSLMLFALLGSYTYKHQKLQDCIKELKNE